MEYPRDPGSARKWKELEDRAAAAEQEASIQKQKARQWRLKYNEAIAKLAAYDTQQVTTTRAINKAVSAAGGKLQLELGKLKSSLIDAKAAVSRSSYDATFRTRARVLAAERHAELERLRFQLKECESKLSAQATRLQQCVARADHGKEQVASMVA